MRCSRWAAIAVAMVLASAAAASADPITIIQDLRFTSAVADPGVRFDADRRVDIGQPNDTMRSAATAVAGMDAGASTATLSSSYADPMRWFGGGSANVSFTTPDKGDYNATSAFRVRFDVNSPVNYNFNESFTISSSLVPPTGNLNAASWMSGATPRSGTGASRVNRSVVLASTPAATPRRRDRRAWPEPARRTDECRRHPRRRAPRSNPWILRSYRSVIIAK